MPYRAWLLVIALGLVLAPISGKTQEEAQEEQWQAQDEQPPTPPLPLPFPIEVVEDQAEAEARQRREEEARQYQIDNLAAQQGLEAATRSMDYATQEMRDFARIQTWLIGAGTGLLVVTLLLTLQANRAAVKSVETVGKLGEAELRAYVDFGGVSWISHWRREDREDIFWRFTVALKNTGTTPSKRLEVRSCMLQAEDLIAPPQIPEHVKRVPLTLGAGQAAGILTFDLGASSFDKVGKGELIIYILIEATYGNAINPKSQHITRIGMKSGAVTGDPLKYWHEIDNPVVIKFNHLRSFNCVDDECQA